MDRLEKVATPLTAATVVVPDSVPPPGLVPMAIVMLAVELVTVLLNASCTVTCKVGGVSCRAGALLGCAVKGRLEDAAGLMVNAAEVVLVSGAVANAGEYTVRAR